MTNRALACFIEKSEDGKSGAKIDRNLMIGPTSFPHLLLAPADRVSVPLGRGGGQK